MEPEEFFKCNSCHLNFGTFFHTQEIIHPQLNFLCCYRMKQGGFLVTWNTCHHPQNQMASSRLSKQQTDITLVPWLLFGTCARGIKMPCVNRFPNYCQDFWPVVISWINALPNLSHLYILKIKLINYKMPLGWPLFHLGFLPLGS